MVALACRNVDEWKHTENPALHILATRRRTLGAEHPDTLTAASSLASTYGAQGRRAEAEALKTQVLGVRARNPGPGDETPAVLSRMANLAAKY